MTAKSHMPLWRRMFRKLPTGIRHRILFSGDFAEKMLEFIRCQKPVSAFMKPGYTPDSSKIVLDITFDCNLGCAGCHKSCNLIHTKDMLSVEQVKKFVHESIEQNRRWTRILISGGEPTLHPGLFEIIDELLNYQRDHSQKTVLELNTNGFGNRVNSVLSRMPSEIKINNSKKINPNKVKHSRFHDAPIDNLAYKFADFSNACWICANCGIALTKYGYYPCCVAASIDRVFGFDTGIKKLPAADYNMRKMLSRLCGYCGHFMRFNEVLKTDPNTVSSTWKKSIEEYKKRKPSLSLY